MAVTDEKVLNGLGLAELWSLIQDADATVAASGLKIATGTYTGTGANNVTIPIGFTPKFVLIFMEASSTEGFSTTAQGAVEWNSQSLGFATSDMAFKQFSVATITCVDGGFKVGATKGSQQYLYNYKNVKFYYIAFG